MYNSLIRAKCFDADFVIWIDGVTQTIFSSVRFGLDEVLDGTEKQTQEHQKNFKPNKRQRSEPLTVSENFNENRNKEDYQQN